MELFPSISLNLNSVPSGRTPRLAGGKLLNKKKRA